MTGPEHYAEAERLANSYPAFGNSNETGLTPSEHIALAQLHATLALVGATVEPVAYWAEVTR